MGPELASLQVDGEELAPDLIEWTGFNAKKGSSTKKAPRARKEFPETWLWTEETIRFV